MRLQRFDFHDLRDFRNPNAAADAPVEIDIVELVAEPPPPPPPVFSENEIEQAKREAYARGLEEGISQGETKAQTSEMERTRQIETLTHEIGLQLLSLKTEHHRYLQERSKELNEFVLAASRKVAGEAMRNAPELAIQALIKECLGMIMLEPKLLLRVHPDVAETMHHQLGKQLQAVSFEGEFVIEPQEDLQLTDCLLSWKNGQARRDTEAMWQHVAGLLKQIDFSAPEPVKSQTPVDETGNKTNMMTEELASETPNQMEE